MGEEEIFETIKDYAKRVHPNFLVEHKDNEYRLCYLLGISVVDILCKGTIERIYGFLLGYKYIVGKIPL